jgi:predicted alpha/beta-hydrolase family hydrolase
VEERLVDTPHGPARLLTRRARKPVVTLVLQHGAGTGVETDDLQALARHLPRHGVSVTLLEQPWRVAGRRLAPAPKSLDEGTIAAVSQLRTRSPLVLGGRSAGARSSARCARTLAAAGCLAVAFPLHPPGRPERSRVEELAGAGVPTLVVQGERDPFGRPEEFPGDLGHLDLAVVPEADHALAVPTRSALNPREVKELLVEVALEWIVREVIGADRGPRPGAPGAASY